MKDVLYCITIALPVWWVAATILGLRDYIRKRRESAAKGPLTDDEKEERAKIAAELPRKEMKPAWWYFMYPKEGAVLGGTVLIALPFVIIFLPVFLIMVLLPSPNRK